MNTIVAAVIARCFFEYVWKWKKLASMKSSENVRFCTLLGVSQAAEEYLEAPIGDSKNWHILFEAVMLEDRSLK